MLRRIEELLVFAYSSPLVLVYLLVAGGAAVENIFPPVPSDTFVLIGGLLADRGVLDPVAVLAVAWASNVAGALSVYGMARRYGRAIFDTGWGHWLLRPHQLDRVSDFYARYGLPAIFGSRFLPVLRVVVPVFAGITGLGFWRTAVPLAVSSAIWYGVLVYAGVLASRNLPRLVALAESVNAWLLAAAAVLALAVLVWWWRTRRHRDDAEAEGTWASGGDAPERAGGPEGRG